MMNIVASEISTEYAANCLSPASFWLPDHLVTSAWTEHAPFGFWLVDALKPSCIVELGVHHGFSYLAFCQAVRNLNLRSHCYGIDTWKGDEHTGAYGEDVYKQLCRDHRRYTGFSRLIRSTFDDAYEQFSDGSIDLLHIDGCHFYEAVWNDFKKWRPKLSSRAVVLFHDTNEPGFGVAKLWQDLCERHRHFEFLHGHGLGVLGIGKNLPIRIEELFSASRNEPSTQLVRAAYSGLGEAISDRQAAKRYETSTSWRLTAPLRAVGLFLQSIRGQKWSKAFDALSEVRRRFFVARSITGVAASSGRRPAIFKSECGVRSVGGHRQVVEISAHVVNPKVIAAATETHASKARTVPEFIGRMSG